MLTESLLHDANKALMTRVPDFHPAINPKSEEKECLASINYQRSFCAVRPLKSYPLEAQNSNASAFKPNNQSQIRLSETPVKTLRNIIISHDPQLRLADALEISSRSTSKQSNSERDSLEFSLPDNPLVKNLVLEYDNKTFKFRKLEDCNQSSVAQLSQGLPVCAFFYSESEYFLYFKKHEDYNSINTLTTDGHYSGRPSLKG